MNPILKYCLFAQVVLLSACNDSSDVESLVEQPLRPVRYVTVSPIELGTMRTFSGLAKAGQESNLSFRVGGSLQSIPAKVGQQLEPGDLIAQLDSSQYQLEAQQASANLSQAQSNLRNMQASFERVKGLYENNNASRNDLDAARASAESSNAQVRAGRKALELARLNVSYTKLKANERCSVAQVLAEANENITAGQTIVSVTCGDRLEVEIAIPESMIALIKRNMDAFVTFSAIPNKRFAATVTEVGVSSISGATYPVTVSLNEKLEGFRSGLAAQVSFALNTNNKQEHLIIPAVSVGKDTKGAYVYLANESNENGVAIVKRQSVEVGELTPQGLEIIDGIKDGDKVITAGVNVIRDGIKVLVD